MIDKEKRNILAESMRQFVSGQVTNDELEERISDGVTGCLPEVYHKRINSQDAAILPLVEYSWYLYDDTRNHFFESSWDWDYVRKEMGRIVLFLKSNQEYTWDYVDMTNPVLRFSFKEIVKSILSFGQYYREAKLTQKEQLEKMKAAGGFEYWPFKTKADYQLALEEPPFLQPER